MLTRFLFRLFFRKEVDEMAAVYVSLIIKGARTYASVPKVKQMLIDLELEELITEEA